MGICVKYLKHSASSPSSLEDLETGLYTFRETKNQKSNFCFINCSLKIKVFKVQFSEK